MINYEDFSKIELRVATVLECVRVDGSEKLLKLQVDLGDPSTSSGPAARQIVAGIGKAYAPENLIGKQIVIVANLEPRKLMGEESNGMLLAVSIEGGLPVLLQPDKGVDSGARVK